MIPVAMSAPGKIRPTPAPLGYQIPGSTSSHDRVDSETGTVIPILRDHLFTQATGWHAARI